MSNVRQLATAELSYAQDYDEMFIPRADGPTNQWLWHRDLITPYIKNTQILTCPSASTLYPGYGVIFATFSMNQYGSYPISGNLADCQYPAEAIMLMESQSQSGAAPTAIEYIYCPTRYATSPGNGLYYGIPFPGRHNSGSNCAFADGHAKWVNDQTLLNKSASCWTTQPPFLY